MQNKLFLRTTLVLFSIYLSSCSTLKDHHCGTQDWAHIGEIDASRLRPAEFLLNHEKVCGIERVNVEQYNTGHTLELKKLCKADDVFIFGYLGKAKNPKCASNSSLEKSYLDGIAFRSNGSVLTTLRERRNAQIEREKADAESQRNEGIGKMIVRSIFPGDPQLDSEKTQIAIQQVEETQREYGRTYEGALIRLNSIDSLARNYEY